MQRHKTLLRQLLDPLSANPLTLASSMAENALVEERILELLADLRDREVPHIALTACVPLPHVVDIRMATLKQLGIAFDFPHRQDMVFEKLRGYCDYPVIYQNQALFSGHCSKGKTLAHFLESLDYRPE